MDIKNIILVIVASLNFLLGFHILFKNFKNKVNLYFGLAVVSTGFWTLAIAIFYSIEDFILLILFARIFYCFGALIFFFFLLFSIVFPYESKIKTLNRFFLVLPLLIILFTILYPGLLIEGIEFEKPEFHYILENSFWQVLFFIYFLVYLSIAYFILIKKFRKSEGLNRSQIKFILIVTPPAFLSGIVFDIILPIYRIYYFDWIGPIFSLIALASVSYLLFSRR